jgi:hypothetical protein
MSVTAESDRVVQWAAVALHFAAPEAACRAGRSTAPGPASHPALPVVVGTSEGRPPRSELLALSGRGLALLGLPEVVDS